MVNLWGARAIGTAGSEAKLARVKEVASFFAINYTKENFQTRIEEAFGANAVDLILDTVGASHWQQNLAVLKYRGTIVLFGLMGGASAETPLGVVLFKRLRIIGTALRGRPLEEKILATRAFTHQVVPHVSAGRLRPVIDSVYTFHDLHQATARMENNENVGKIVITFS
jgi:NADPH:quinone reductase-like Zn-dependent oxidoreductase